MIEKTPGIVLTRIKYGDTSLIVRVFTKNFGIQSYIIKGIRSSKSKKNAGIFQPLTLLDMVVYHKPGREIHHATDMQIRFNFKTIPFNVKKSAIAVFVAELLLKIQAALQDAPTFFDYLEDQIIHLDQTPFGFEDKHIYMVLASIRFLGIGGFHTQEFKQMAPHPEFENPKFCHAWELLMNNEKMYLNADFRIKMLQVMLQYLSNHDIDCRNMKSLAILHEVFAE